jgi:exo-beta-1,3-glucanase (GH17 family)
MVTNVLIILLLCAFAQADMQALLTAMTPTTTSTGCTRFSPYVNGLSPNGGPTPNATLINELLDILVAKTQFRCIMIDDMSGVFTTVIQGAHDRGIKVFGVTYISADFKANGDINMAITMANKYPDTIVGISCGLEVAWRNKDLSGTANAVTSCVSTLKNANVTQPIGYCDTFGVWCNLNDWPCYNGYYAIYNYVDFIGLDGKHT